MSIPINSKPYFSIIIPTYNRAKLIQKTLKSVLSQTFEDFEVIIIDNCSEDNSVEALQKYLEDKRFKLIVNKRNLERAGARNVGFKAAEGKFLTLLDSDDFMYASNLQDAYDFSQNNPQIYFFHNLYELVDEDMKSIGKYSYPSSNIQRAISKGNFLSCIGVFLHRKVYTEYLFDEDSRVLGSEDWELWLRILAEYPLGRINKINSAILAHENRSIHQFALEKIMDRKMFIIDKCLHNPKTAEVYTKYESLMKASAYLFTAVQSNESRLRSLSFKYMFESFKERPSIIFTKRFLTVLKNATLQ